jgi:hypothetical protein
LNPEVGKGGGSTAEDASGEKNGLPDVMLDGIALGDESALFGVPGIATGDCLSPSPRSAALDPLAGLVGMGLRTRNRR